MMATLEIVCIILTFIKAGDAFDPCNNPSSLFSVDFRGTNCFLYEKGSALCDRLIKPGWYKAESNGISLDMPTSCPQPYACGTASPIWMKGKLPKKSEGIVTRTACMRGFTDADCCNTTTEIQVKHCGTFYAYNLKVPDFCDRSYCFGSNKCPVKSTPVVPYGSTKIPRTYAPNDPCITYSSLNNIGNRGVKCKLYDTNSAICDRLLKTGWYKAEQNGHALDMLNYCVDSYSCGTADPIWLNGSLSLRPYEVARRTACIRGQNPSQCCPTSFQLMVKNCVNYNVYFLPYTTLCDTGYCFGQHKCTTKEEVTQKVETVIIKNQSETNGQTIAMFILLGLVIVILAVCGTFFILRFLKMKGLQSSKVNMVPNHGPVISPNDYDFVKRKLGDGHM